MPTIWARNVNDAWAQAVRLINAEGVLEKSRGGAVLVHPEPVLTRYERPQERVLYCEVRDANPIFHLMESLWMLAGWRDSRWLDTFVADFSERYGERDGLMWGAYGGRWRNWFLHDQLKIIGDRLVNDHQDRRSVLGMWDPGRDLCKYKTDFMKDYPCNTHAYFRVRDQGKVYYLDMTVCCRSNDIVWGAYGANAVHFSVLLEYMAVRIGARIGHMYQLSNNWHMYESSAPARMPTFMGAEQNNPYHDDDLTPDPIVWSAPTFDDEVARWVAAPGPGPWQNRFLRDTAWPVYDCGVLWRRSCDKDNQHRDRHLAAAIDNTVRIRSPDWRKAVREWLERRRQRRAAWTGSMSEQA